MLFEGILETQYRLNHLHLKNRKKFSFKLLIKMISKWNQNYQKSKYYNKWGLIIVLSNNWSPIKDTKRTKVKLDRDVAPWSRPTINVIGPLHECKKVCPCTKALPQSGIRAWIKQGRRKRKKRDRKDRGQEAGGKKGS